MGRDCRYCGRERPNEAFSGKGHRIGICKRCAQRPKAEREPPMLIEEIAGFLDQSNISEKNRQRLGLLVESPYPEVAGLAKAVLAIASRWPRKKRRWQALRQLDPAFFAQLEEMELVPDYYYENRRIDDLAPDDEPEHLMEPGEFDERTNERTPHQDADDGWEDIPFWTCWQSTEP